MRLCSLLVFIIKVKVTTMHPETEALNFTQKNLLTGLIGNIV